MLTPKVCEKNNKLSLACQANSFEFTKTDVNYWHDIIQKLQASFHGITFSFINDISRRISISPSLCKRGI